MKLVPNWMLATSWVWVAGRACVDDYWYCLMLTWVSWCWN